MYVDWAIQQMQNDGLQPYTENVQVGLPLQNFKELEVVSSQVKQNGGKKTIKLQFPKLKIASFYLIIKETV